ncbi:PH domain-containing protein [Haloferula rosea]|uniref:PH domain-containing protein n=1 Tax=Haloferula rosea TaxID=490093 RepID=A0A934R939_9BACT|nr:PH domain-containing protein [Haloferula rosea]MBK1826597.1 PH domain-containing protein [Haloferula rosea]
MSENVLWKGRPSQLLNLGTYLVGTLLIVGIGIGGTFFPPAWFAGIIPLVWMLWKFLTVRCRVYELTNERLRLYTGVLNQKIDELELYRVKDTTMDKPFMLRIFGLATVHLDTSDRSHPKVELHAISNAVELRETLREQVERLRDLKRVREVDFEEGGEMEGDDFHSD